MGRVLCVKRRGVLLRCDAEKDGWARIEADFTEEGQLETIDADTEDAMILEGWVLLDGRDLGLPRQAQKYNNEKVPPVEEPRKTRTPAASTTTGRRSTASSRSRGPTGRSSCGPRA